MARRPAGWRTRRLDQRKLFERAQVETSSSRAWACRRAWTRCTGPVSMAAEWHPDVAAEHARSSSRCRRRSSRSWTRAAAAPPCANSSWRSGTRAARRRTSRTPNVVRLVSQLCVRAPSTRSSAASPHQTARSSCHPCRVCSRAPRRPRARAISAGDPSLKSLHAASHKGLCSLHRVIASVGAEQADAVLPSPSASPSTSAAFAAGGAERACCWARSRRR